MKDWVRVQLFVHLLISNRMKWNSNVVQSHPPSVHTPWGPALNVRLRETQRKWLKSGRGTSLPSCASGITPSMRFSVSSPDETPRRELKIRRAAEYFWRTSRCFIWWWNTVSNAWYYFSNKMILEGEIKDAEMSSFSSDFHTLITHSIVFSLWIIDEFEKVGSMRECGWKPMVLPFNWNLPCR